MAIFGFWTTSGMEDIPELPLPLVPSSGDSESAAKKTTGTNDPPNSSRWRASRKSATRLDTAARHGGPRGRSRRRLALDGRPRPRRRWPPQQRGRDVGRWWPGAAGWTLTGSPAARGAPAGRMGLRCGQFDSCWRLVCPVDREAPSHLRSGRWPGDVGPKLAAARRQCFESIADFRDRPRRTTPSWLGRRRTTPNSARRRACRPDAAVAAYFWHRCCNLSISTGFQNGSWIVESPPAAPGDEHERHQDPQRLFRPGNAILTKEVSPPVALNCGGTVLEVHKNQEGHNCISGLAS